MNRRSSKFARVGSGRRCSRDSDCTEDGQEFRVDIVENILDALDRLHHKLSGSGMRMLLLQQKHDREASLQRQDSDSETRAIRSQMNALNVEEESSSKKRPFVSEFGVKCQNCKTTDASQLRVDEANCVVCSCGAVGMATGVADFQNMRHCAKVETGDRSMITDGFGAGTSKAEIRKAVQRTETPQLSTAFGGNAAQKLKAAEQSAASNAAADKRDDSLCKSNMRRLTSIIEAMENLIAQLGPIESSLARKLRMDVDFVFRSSVKHCEICTLNECQRSLYNKPAGVVASKSLTFTVEQLMLGYGTEGINRQAVAVLHEKIRGLNFFNVKENSAQHQSCMAMLLAIHSGNNERVCKPSKPEDSTDAMAAAKLALVEHSHSMQRHDSEDSIKSSPMIQLRDAVTKVCDEINAPATVRDRAIQALQDPAFDCAVNRLHFAAVRKDSTAYCVVHAVGRHLGGAAFETPEQHEWRLGKFSLDEPTFRGAVSSLCLAVPPKPADDSDDDDFY